MFIKSRLEGKSTFLLTVLSLVAGLLLTIPVSSQAANATCATNASAQNNIAVAPSHGKVFYIDTGVSPVIDAAYIGYRITNTTGATIRNYWASLTNFTGGVVSLARADDQYIQIPEIANNATKTIYVLVKARTATRIAQTHTLKIFSGRPDVAGASASYLCDFSFTKVAETIKASANKVTSITVSGDGTPELGELITVTAEGATGTIGAGSADVGRILWFSPAAFSSFPTVALRLESVRLVTADNANWNNSSDIRVYEERLLIDTSIAPNTGTTTANAEGVKSILTTTDNLVGKRYYKNSYRFRVIGKSTSAVAMQPVAQISSGTQIKHTDLSQTPSASINTQSTSITLTVTKSVTSTSNLTETTVNGTVYFEVPYKVTIDNTAATGTVTIDEIVDTPASGVSYVANSVAVTAGTGTAIAPVILSSEANLSPQPLHFFGPFSVSSATNFELTYKMYVPKAGSATYKNSAVAYIGSQPVGANTSSISIVNVVTNNNAIASANTSTETLSPVATTLPATSIATTTATLNGTVDPNNQTPSAVFEWSTNQNLSSPTTISLSNSVAGSDVTSFTSNFTGTAGTRYYYRIVAIVNSTRYEGDIETFVLLELPSDPLATTLGVSDVDTNGRYATLNGSIDPNLQSISEVRFVYSINSNLTSSTTKILYELDEAGAETATKVTLSGANPIDVLWASPQASNSYAFSNNTTYYYRVEGTYVEGGITKTVVGNTRSFRTGAQTQTITFNAINDQPYANGSYNITSGNNTTSAYTSAFATLSLTFTSETTAICTVENDLSDGSATVTFVKAGFCVITASQDGNTSFLPAEPVTRQFEITPSAPTATTTAPATSIAKTTATIAGSVTTGGSTETTVTFTFGTNANLTGGTTVTAIQSPLAANGNASYNLTGLTAGTVYYYRISASNATGSANGNIETFTTENLVTITITADNKSKNYLENSPAFTYQITSGNLINGHIISGLTYTFANAVGTPAYGPSTSVPSEGGSYSITPSAATFSSGAASDYNITYVAGSYTINKINQSALQLADRTLSQSSTYTLATTGGSGTGAVSYAQSAETFAGAGNCTIANTDQITTPAENGTCTITATKAEDRNYNAATANGLMTINSAIAQTITFVAPNDRAFSPNAFAHAASASSTLDVTMTSNSLAVCTVSTPTSAGSFNITMLKAGTCSITASQSGGAVGNNTYNAADSVTREFVISKAARTITIKSSVDAGYETSYVAAGYASWALGAPTLLSLATSDDSDSKTYSIGAGATGCTVAANGSVTFTGAGTCKATVSITGLRYLDATSAEITFTIGKRNQTITFNQPANRQTDAADENLPTTTDASINITFSTNDVNICSIVGAAGAYKLRTIGAGDCTVSADASGNDDYNAATQVVRTFTITSPNAGGGGGGGGGGVVAPVIPGPTITNVSKSQICSVGQEVIITGIHFDGGSVTLDGVQANIRIVSSMSITVLLPQALAGRRLIKVTTPYGFDSAIIEYVSLPKPRFEPIRIPYLAQGSAINLPFAALNATTYRLVGQLPSGLTLNGNTGLISGTPTENGIFVFTLVASGICGDTNQFIELDIDAPTPNAVSHRINFTPKGCEIPDSAKASLERFIDQVKGIAPRNIIPEIYISGGSPSSDPDDPTAQCRADAICDFLLLENLLGQVLTDVFTGSPNRIEIIVYFPRPNDDL